MLLFLTREARFKFSIEERLVGEGDASRGSRFSPFCRIGEVESRFCQYARVELEENGDVLNLFAKGDESKGEESRNDFYT